MSSSNNHFFIPLTVHFLCKILCWAPPELYLLDRKWKDVWMFHNALPPKGMILGSQIITPWALNKNNSKSERYILPQKIGAEKLTQNMQRQKQNKTQEVKGDSQSDSIEKP